MNPPTTEPLGIWKRWRLTEAEKAVVEAAKRWNASAFTDDYHRACVELEQAVENLLREPE